MSAISISVLAFSLSIDAFVASLGKGAARARPSIVEALKIGLVFGLVALGAPLLGWVLGLAASGLVAAVDHWVAFVLLCCVGAHMIHSAWSRSADDSGGAMPFWTVLAAAVGTSIDALAVGVSMAFLKADILFVALAIGGASLAFSAAGVLAGRFVNRRFGRLAETLGGAGLILLGASIPYAHLNAA